MATVATRNQGKTPFVKEVLGNNPHATAKLVNEAWQAAGREGTISETLVNKMRSELGLAGNLRGRRRRRAATAAAGKPAYTGKKRGRKPKSAQPVPNDGRTGDGPRGKAVGRQQRLVALEADIDRLLFKVMNLGELPEVEEGLRQTRRLLYRGLSGK
jgi:hypothetical protein